MQCIAGPWGPVSLRVSLERANLPSCPAQPLSLSLHVSVMEHLSRFAFRLGQVRPAQLADWHAPLPDLGMPKHAELWMPMPIAYICSQHILLTCCARLLTIRAQARQAPTGLPLIT